MPILEPQLNGRIATLLDRMTPSLDRARREQRRVFLGSQRQPDILIVQARAHPVVIENEYAPAVNVEAEALQRLGEQLNSNIVVPGSGRIEAAVALQVT